MKLALKEAEKALQAGEFPVGCVIVDEDTVVASAARIHTTAGRANEIDHAEMVALRRMAELGKHIPPGRPTLFSTLEPCLMCMGAIILNGIGKVVYAYEDIMGGAARCDLSHAAPLYRNSRIKIVPGVLREKSARLFKSFFETPDNAYWNSSTLAEYTLGLNLDAST